MVGNDRISDEGNTASGDRATVVYPVNSFDKGLQLLELFRGPDVHVRVTDAARRAGISTSTAHRLLSMMKQRGFVRQDPRTHTYFAGAALLDLAQSLIEEVVICRAAIDEMTDLTSRTGEMSMLCVLRGSEAHFIATLRSPTGIADLPTRLGSPAHSTAGGKVLLGELTRAELIRLYSRANLKAQTVQTITRRRTLERELTLVRQRGYASSVGENRLGVTSIAVPIRSVNGKAFGALCVLGNDRRLPSERIPKIVEQLRAGAKRIAIRLDRAFLFIRNS